MQGAETWDGVGYIAERSERGGNVAQKIGFVLGVPEKTVGAEGLHKALEGAEAKDMLEIGFIVGDGVLIKRKELGAFGGVEVHVRIVEQRGKIVMGQAETHSLEIDHPGGLGMDENVLRLEIAMKQHAGEFCELVGDICESREIGKVHF